MNRDIVEASFDLVREIIEELQIHENTSKLFNMDKTGLPTKIALKILLLEGGRMQRLYARKSCWLLYCY
jgi:hypothetical protein